MMPISSGVQSPPFLLLMAPRFTLQFVIGRVDRQVGRNASMKPSETPRTIFISSMVS